MSFFTSATPAMARELYMSMSRPTDQKVADILSNSGHPVSKWAIQKWRRRGWTRARDPEPPPGYVPPERTTPIATSEEGPQAKLIDRFDVEGAFVHKNPMLRPEHIIPMDHRIDATLRRGTTDPMVQRVPDFVNEAVAEKLANESPDAIQDMMNAYVNKMVIIYSDFLARNPEYCLGKKAIQATRLMAVLVDAGRMTNESAPSSKQRTSGKTIEVMSAQQITAEGAKKSEDAREAIRESMFGRPLMEPSVAPTVR